MNQPNTCLSTVRGVEPIYVLSTKEPTCGRGVEEAAQQLVGLRLVYAAEGATHVPRPPPGDDNWVLCGVNIMLCGVISAPGDDNCMVCGVISAPGDEY